MFGLGGCVIGGGRPDRPPRGTESEQLTHAWDTQEQLTDRYWGRGTTCPPKRYIIDVKILKILFHRCNIQYNYIN